MAKALNGKAYRLFKENNYNEAVSLMTQAIEIAERTVGPDDKEVGKLLVDLACAYKRLEDSDEARFSLQRARTILLKFCVPEHPDIKQIDSMLQGFSGK